MNGKSSYKDEEKSVVQYLKDVLKSRGVEKLPRDWHLKQLATAKIMLSGEKAPGVEEWKACIDWAFHNPFWCDKVDHLAAIERLWPKFVLQNGGQNGTSKENSTKRGRYNAGKYVDKAFKGDKMPF
jgi:hypothetical protein